MLSCRVGGKLSRPVYLAPHPLGYQSGVVSKPTCRHCAAGVQLFKWCRYLSAGTVLQRCSCLSGVETYMPALCCRGAAV